MIWQCVCSNGQVNYFEESTTHLYVPFIIWHRRISYNNVCQFDTNTNKRIGFLAKLLIEGAVIREACTLEFAEQLRAAQK